MFSRRRRSALADLGALSPNFDSQSLVNSGPDFMSYSVESGGNATVQSIVLSNGQVVGNQAVAFNSERMYSAALDGPAGPGMSALGPGVFVSYPENDGAFVNATKIFLHRCAGAAVSGPLSHDPVVRLDIDDQYQGVSTTLYDPGPSQAACDPTGLVIKYYLNTVYPGTTDPTQPLYGFTQNRYLNGLELDLQGITAGDYHNMLDGLLCETAIYDADGQLLESRQSSWQVVQQVASHPTDASAPAIPLAGGWVAQTTETKVCDGVTTVKTSTFTPDSLPGPYTGRPVQVSMPSSNGAGQVETWTESYRYGPEVVPAMLALNMRSTHAQSTTSQANAFGTATVIKRSATSFALWPSGAGTGVTVPAHEASFRYLDGPNDEFPFGSYQVGSTPVGWQLDGRVTRRTRADRSWNRSTPSARPGP